ncbi:MAG: shikimate dehydrogenase [Phycisphaerae bacterium]|nr:shikimate dehydrogenase [Phycisphaerae bacterium]
MSVMDKTGHPTRLICPLTASSVEEMRAEMIAAVAEGAEMVECRLDYLTPPPDDEQLADLLSNAPCAVLITCRPRREGGRFSGEEHHRLAILAAAAKFPRVEITDVELDVPPEDRPATGPILLSHHDFQGCPADLDDIGRAMDASEAAVNKIAFTPAGPDGALRALDVIRACKKPTLALAMGEAGVLTRILAKKFGAWGMFASLHAGKESAPGQLSLAEMKHLYRWEAVNDQTRVYGVIGCPIAHSMSPAIHNAAFEATGFNGVYVPLRIEPGPKSFNAFLDAARARPELDLRGLSVTIPHKENALAYVGADHCDALAVRIGAVNTITIDEAGSLRGDNTDYAGAIDALCEAMNIPREGLARRRVAVLGAGGASRAIVAALRHYNAEVTLYNRTLSRAEALAEEFGCSAAALSKADRTEAQIVVNCTALGMHPNVETSPVSRLSPSVRVVFDTVYNPLETRLLAMANSAGCLCVSGLDMFVNQAVAQFERWTNLPAPRDVMRDVVRGRLHE